MGPVANTKDLHTDEELETASDLEVMRLRAVLLRDHVIYLMQQFPEIWGNEEDGWDQLVQQD